MSYGESLTAEVPVLSLEDVSMFYGAVRALDSIDLSINQGDVIGLVGDNGAGKSTLVKCINGVLTPSTGHISIEGSSQELTANQVRHKGVETVHQDLGLIKTLPVWENFFINREVLVKSAIGRALQIVDKKAMRRQTHAALAGFNVDTKLVDREVSTLSGGQRQIVAVIRAVSSRPRVVLLDEPTASLGVEQSELVLKLVEFLRSKDVASVFVSHNMQHVFRVSNRIVVLRRGVKVADVPTSETTPREVVALITGSHQMEGGFA